MRNRNSYSSKEDVDELIHNYDEGTVLSRGDLYDYDEDAAVLHIRSL